MNGLAAHRLRNLPKLSAIEPDSQTGRALVNGHTVGNFAALTIDARPKPRRRQRPFDHQHAVTRTAPTRRLVAWRRQTDRLNVGTNLKEQRFQLAAIEPNSPTRRTVIQLDSTGRRRLDRRARAGRTARTQHAKTVACGIALGYFPSSNYR